jgi:oxygen-independent coproporphyrinogen-3 oxidase
MNDPKIGMVKSPTRQFRDLPPLSLYVHIPWCAKKCPYCDFNSHVNRSPDIPEDAYVAALLADVEQELPDIWGRQVVSIFFGGGTPSLLSPGAIDRILSGLRARLALLPGCEITLEANPGTFEQEKFSEFRSAGVNRLSIGIQSFDDRCLEALGRIHSSDEAQRAVSIARYAGFERLNLDLMFGLPQQTHAMAQADLAQAIALAPEHLSWYQLTIEPNTLFYKSPPPTPLPDDLWQLQIDGLQTLSDAGYQRYEISAFARDGDICLHNMNYWRFGDYLAIGAGAHGKLSFASDSTILRRHKVRHPRDYLRKASTAARIADQYVVPPEDTPLEFMMNAMRLNDGVERELFEYHTGLPLATIAPTLSRAESLGLLEKNPHRLKPTEQGYDHLNTLLELFMDTDQLAKVIPIKPA